LKIEDIVEKKYLSKKEDLKVLFLEWSVSGI
jgi:hypothetical protein